MTYAALRSAGGWVRPLRASIGDAALPAQDVALVASKVVDEMFIDITHVPDTAVKCSEPCERGVVPGVDDPIDRVRLQGNDLTGKQSDCVAQQLREFNQADLGECALYMRHNPAGTILKVEAVERSIDAQKPSYVNDRTFVARDPALGDREAADQFAPALAAVTMCRRARAMRVSNRGAQY